MHRIVWWLVLSSHGHSEKEKTRFAWQHQQFLAILRLRDGLETSGQLKFRRFTKSESILCFISSSSGCHCVTPIIDRDNLNTKTPSCGAHDHRMFSSKNITMAENAFKHFLSPLISIRVTVHPMRCVRKK